MILLRKRANLLVIVCLALVAVAWSVFGPLKTSAHPSSIFFEATTVATTTRTFIGNGVGTSTFQFDNSTFSSAKIANMQTVDSLSLYLQVEASSTVTQYIIQPQYSNNNVDWYGMGSQGTASAGGATAISTTSTFTWTPGTVATTSMVFNLPSVPTTHERVIVSALGGAGAYYAEVDLKQNPSTP